MSSNWFRVNLKNQNYVLWKRDPIEEKKIQKLIYEMKYYGNIDPSLQRWVEKDLRVDTFKRTNKN